MANNTTTCPTCNKLRLVGIPEDIIRRVHRISNHSIGGTGHIQKPITDSRVKYMVNRFLSWKLPEDFVPDAGISFKPTFNEHTANPGRHRPIGTNLFTAPQAEAMIWYLIDGMEANHE